MFGRVSLCDLNGKYLCGEALRISTCHQGEVLYLGLTLGKHSPEAWLHTYTGPKTAIFSYKSPQPVSFISNNKNIWGYHKNPMIKIQWLLRLGAFSVSSAEN